MLPAPASIAAAPSPRSRVPWNPAVPPPPVGGAPVGIGLVVGGDGDEFPSLLVEGLADGRADGLFEWLVLGLGVLGLGVPEVGVPELGVLVPPVPLGETAGLAGLLAVGEDVGGSAAEGEDVVQAETTAQANMAAMPQPTALKPLVGKMCNGLFTTKHQVTPEDQRLGSWRGGLRYWGICSGAA
jgi:hypothetical protein